MLQVIKEAAITHTNDCDSALQSAHDLPSSAVSNQLANHMTELDEIIRECGNTAKRLSVVNASLKDWTAANIALQQVMNNRTNSLNAVNTLASSDAFMIENRLSKSKVCIMSGGDNRLVGSRNGQCRSFFSLDSKFRHVKV